MEGQGGRGAVYVGGKKNMGGGVKGGDSQKNENSRWGGGVSAREGVQRNGVKSTSTRTTRAK